MHLFSSRREDGDAASKAPRSFAVRAGSGAKLKPSSFGSRTELPVAAAHPVFGPPAGSRHGGPCTRIERASTCRKVDAGPGDGTTSSRRAPAVAVDGQLPIRLRSLVASQQRRDVSASRDVRGPSSLSHRAPETRRPRSALRFIARCDESEMDPARSSHSFDTRREAGRGSRFDSSSTPTQETRSRDSITRAGEPRPRFSILTPE